MPILLPSHGTNTLDDYMKVVDKRLVIQYFNRVSGAGSLSYVGTASTEGAGRLSFTGGAARWELKAKIPVSELRGLGLNMNHQQVSGTGSVNIGIACYDANEVFLSNRNVFFTGATPVSSTNNQNTVYTAGATTSTFPSGTRFVKFYIDIISNTGVYIIDRPYLNYLSIAQKALYV